MIIGVKVKYNLAHFISTKTINYSLNINLFKTLKLKLSLKFNECNSGLTEFNVEVLLLNQRKKFMNFKSCFMLLPVGNVFYVKK